MKLFFNSLLMGIICAVMSATSYGSVIYTGGTLSENFDSLPDSTTDINDLWDFPANGSVVKSLDLAAGGTSGWDGTQLVGSGEQDFRAVTLSGGTTAGSVLSAGVGTVAGLDNERAVGVLSSGSRTPAIGVEIVNGTGEDLTFVTIEFTQELWRHAGNTNSGATGEANIVLAGWSQTGATGVTNANYLSEDALFTTGGFTAVSALDLVSPAPPANVVTGYVDGNDPINRTLGISATINFSSPIANGDSFFLRFQDVNNAGGDAVLAIDDFTLTSNVVPEPGSMLLLGVSLFGILFSTIRRKK